MPFPVLARTEALSPANLTIRERVRLAENPNELRWPALFPRVEAESVKLSSITGTDFRPAGGRREWNAQGREIPEVLGPIQEAEMVPINPTHHIDERRLQNLRERAGGMAQLIDAGVVKDVDQWATFLANAADIQIEVDAFQAWFLNQITVMDPKTGTTTTVNVGTSSDRYVQAASALTYLEFMGHLENAQAALGSLGAVRMRRSVVGGILATAPAFSGDRMSLAGLRERVNNEGFGDVAIVIDERTYDAFTDGGSATTATKYVPADRIAFQPADGRIGNTHDAPVTRAYDYMNPESVGGANGVTVFYSEKNDGKTLMVEAQRNALSLPDPQRVYVVYDVVAAT